MTAPRPHRATEPRDEGRVLLLSLVYCAILVGLILVVAAATTVHLERKRLLDLADLTALQAADAMTADAYLAAPDPAGVVHLTDDAVRQAAEAHLAAAPETARFRGVQLVDATTPDGRTAVIRLRAVVDVPFAFVATDLVTIEVLARARSG